MGPIILSVSEFNQTINHLLGQIGEVIVEGEIIELKISQNKWIFGTIKDKDATLEIFGSVFQIHNLNSLKPGMLVKTYGIARLYEKTGRFSLSANQIIPSGIGSLQIAFEKLKMQLEKEGLFAPERKRRLPEFPQKIGLITAKGSQAYNDFTKVIRERMGGINIVFYPAQVQGQESATSIINAIKHLNAQVDHLDLIVLTRGGGSLEDLASFNDEQVARTIFSSKVPVVTAVGHEGDTSLADLVGDLRASTPSNAAELIVRDRREVINQVESIEKSISSKFQQLMNGYADKADLLTATVVRWLHKVTDRVNSLERLIDNLDHRQVLTRGYSITLTDTNQIIKSVLDIKAGQAITTIIADGKIDSTVISSEK